MAQMKAAVLGATLASLATPCLGAVRVWKMCSGKVPEMPSPEAMAADVEVGFSAECSQEYTFDEMCALDMQETLDTDFTVEQSIFIKAANRRASSPDGSMAEDPDCLAGTECYVICTSGDTKAEIAVESSDAPTASFAVRKTGGSPQKFTTDCSAKYFSKAKMLAGELFKYRQEYLLAQGVAPGSDTLVCPYQGEDPRFSRPQAASTTAAPSLVASAVKLHLRGGHAEEVPACQTLASLASMKAEAILKQFPVIGFMKTAPNATTMSHQGKIFKKFVVHHVQWDAKARRMSLRAYAKQQLDVDAESGTATLTTYTKPAKRQEVFSGKDICIEVPKESVRETAKPGTAALAQTETEESTRLFGSSGSASLASFDWTAGL